MAGSPRRWSVIFRRWVAVAVVGASAVSAFLICAVLVDHTVASAVQWLDTGWKRPAGAVLLFAMAIVLVRSGILGNPGLKKAHVNPPRWLQVALFVAVVVAVWSYFPTTRPASLGVHVSALLRRWGSRASAYLLLAATAVVVAPHLAILLRRVVAPRLAVILRRRRTGSADASREVVVLAQADFKRVCEWLRTDDEISDPSDDVFGHSLIANRIADRLTQAAKGALGRCPTFALIGELGSGKSSILELVRHSLRARDVLDRRILVISASLWPFDSPEAAIRGILEAIERGFSRITSVSSIARAPAGYLRAIGKMDKRAEMLAELLSREKTPAEVLEAYGQLARLVGVHVVVWVEDLERFEGSASRDGSRAAPIRALLYQMQRIERLTVVLASDNLNARVDLQKIARFVESISLIDTANAWPVVSTVREGCLAMLKAKGEVDPASRKARLELSTVEDPALSMLVRTFGATATLKGAIVHFCRTPRVLKQALRDAFGVWDSLQGEIDLDDVLLMCVLRAARPDIFAVVDEYVDVLRGPSEHRRDAKKDDEAFKAALLTLVGGDADTKAALDEILTFVFHVGTNASLSPRDKPQGLAIQQPRDYWRRFLTAPPLTLAERDQPILRAIAEWNAGTSSVLAEVLCDTERSAVAEHIVDRINSRRVSDLLDAVVAIHVEESTVKWPASDNRLDDRGPPGLSVIWRICHRKKEAGALDRGALTSALKRAIDVAVPRNLRLADELLRLFASDSHNRYEELVEEAGRRDLFGQTQKLLSGFSGDPDRLVAALKDSYRFRNVSTGMRQLVVQFTVDSRRSWAAEPSVG